MTTNLRLLAPLALLGITGSAHAALVWQLPLSGGVAGSIAANTVLTAAVNDGVHPMTNGTVIGGGSSWVNDSDWGTTVWRTVQNNRILAGTQGADRTTGFTWSIWTKADPTAAGNADGGAEVIMGTRSGTYVKLGPTGLGSSISPTVTIAIPTVFDNTWKNISVIGDATNVRIYVNGTLTGIPDTTTALTWNPNWEIGGSAQFTEDMEGLMRDAAAWNNALSASQVVGLYTLGAPTSLKYDSVQAQSLYSWADAAPLNDVFELNGTKWQKVNDDWSLNAGQLQDLGGGDYRFGYDSTYALITVPEPGVALLGSLGLLGLLRRRRA